MKIKNILLAIVFSFVGVAASAQAVSGVVTASDTKEPLVGAAIYWLNTTVGVSSNVDGDYNIHRVKGYDMLVATYVGYRADTVKVADGQTKLDFELKPDTELEEVVVEGGLTVSSRAKQSLSQVCVRWPAVIWPRVLRTLHQ